MAIPKVTLFCRWLKAPHNKRKERTHRMDNLPCQKKQKLANLFATIPHKQKNLFPTCPKNKNLTKKTKLKNVKRENTKLFQRPLHAFLILVLIQ